MAVKNEVQNIFGNFVVKGLQRCRCYSILACVTRQFHFERWSKMAKHTELVANEFKAGKWFNSFPVASIEEFREIVESNIKCAAKYKWDAAKLADLYNCETRGGTVVEVIRVPQC